MQSDIAAALELDIRLLMLSAFCSLPEVEQSEQHLLEGMQRLSIWKQSCWMRQHLTRAEWGTWLSQRMESK